MKWEDQQDVSNFSLVPRELSTPLIGLQLQQVSAWNRYWHNMKLGLTLKYPDGGGAAAIVDRVKFSTPKFHDFSLQTVF